MRNISLNSLGRTSFLNKEQSFQSSQLHCVVTVTAGVHHFKMMKRNEELGSTEIGPDGGTLAGGAEASL